MNANDMRIGHGFDVHRFSENFNDGRPLILAGVLLPEERSLVAHSDGDVILHAICDAVLGAVGGGDIGQHFPDNDEKYSGIASGVLLKQVLEIIDQKQFWLVNVDITVVAQVPKLTAYRQEMISSLSNLLELPENRVNLKATTTEGLGYIGREEGIACHAVVLLAGNA
jgi:2-C-methyl-D-erythritol 2,4-cyclodiphosphate synthase